jgi:hypothetical protein
MQVEYEAAAPDLKKSRVLSGLNADGISCLARLAVAYGVVAHVDATGDCTSKFPRVVLPVQLEILQAVLLQLIARSTGEVDEVLRGAPPTRALLKYLIYHLENDTDSPDSDVNADPLYPHITA